MQQRTSMGVPSRPGGPSRRLRVGMHAILGVVIAVVAVAPRMPAASAQTTATSGADVCARVAYDAGFRADPLVTAVAVGLVESECRPWATGENGPTWGCLSGSYDRGLWQINSCYHPTVTDACAYDAACNARETYRISSGGTNWRPWYAFTSGAYLGRLEEARAAVGRLGTDTSSTAPVAGPAVASWSAGRLDVFKRGADAALWQRTFTGGAWSPWVSLGGVLTSEPAAVSWGPDRIDVFVRGTDNGLWHRAFSGGWGSWGSLGGVLTSAPAVASWDVGRLDVFARGTDNGLWQRGFSGAWGGWVGLGGTLASAPAAVSWGPGRIDVFFGGADRALWHRAFSGAWGGATSLGGVLTSAPAVASWGSGRLDVYVRGTDNAVWRRYFSGSWSGWGGLGGGLTSAPGAVSWGLNRIDLFVVGTDAGLWHKWFDGSWRPWAGLGPAP